MKETHITIYIHDLEISDKSKSFLARVGLMKLDDLLNCNMTELSAMRNISEDVLQEQNESKRFFLMFKMRRLKVLD